MCCITGAFALSPTKLVFKTKTDLSETFSHAVIADGNRNDSRYHGLAKLTAGFGIQVLEIQIWNANLAP